MLLKESSGGSRVPALMPTVMAEIYISGTSFTGFGPGHGSPIQANCPVHGSFTGYLPFDLRGSRGSIDRSAITCPKCGRPGLLPQLSFDFTKEVVYDLFGVSLSRPQRRRFERLAKEAKSPEDAREKADRIHPRLARAVAKTKGTPDWRAALQNIANIITILVGLPAAIATADLAVDLVRAQLIPHEQNSEPPEKPHQKDDHKDDDTGGDAGGNGSSGGRSDWDDVIDT